MRRLVMIDLPAGPAFVDALRRVWDAGDAAFPVDRRLPAPARRDVVSAMAPCAVIDETGDEIALDEGRPVEDGDALVVATSGSTGSPKGVVLTHDAIAASARASTTRIGRDAADHWLACLPLSHVGGLAVITRSLLLDLPLTVHDGFDPTRVTAAADAGCTLVSLVPTAIARIEPSRFRTVVLGGSRPPADRPANVLATYGMTETGSGIVYEGRPLDGVELSVVEDEICVRGPMLLRCYRDGSDPKSSDGWLATGDLGALSSDGTLSVAGRRGDLIITGGENVWPEAVERCLASHPAVQDIAVAGAPDPEWGDRVVAYVVVSPRATRSPVLEELRDHVKAHLPTFCAPRELVIVAQIPRTSLGKVRRSDLHSLRSPDRA